MTLYLLPTTLDESQDKSLYLSKEVHNAVSQIDGLFAESERAGRRYLSWFQTKISFRELPIVLVNEHTKKEEYREFLKPIKASNQVWGLVSDCGTPCIADPGEELVNEAYSLGITVNAFQGPCSLLLALELSGLPAERFAFRGYLPREKEARIQEIAELDMRCKKYKETEICMEAPYRNKELLQDLIQTLSPECVLVVCVDLSLPTQTIMRKRVSDWRKAGEVLLPKAPALFVFNYPFK